MLRKLKNFAKYDETPSVRVPTTCVITTDNNAIASVRFKSLVDGRNSGMSSISPCMRP